MDALRDLDFCFRIFQYFKRCQELGFLCETFCFSNAGNQLKIFLKTFCSPKGKKKKEQKHAGGQIGPGHYHFTTCVLSEKMSLLYVETSFCFFLLCFHSLLSHLSSISFPSVSLLKKFEITGNQEIIQNYMYTCIYGFRVLRGEESKCLLFQKFWGRNTAWTSTKRHWGDTWA